MRCATKKRLTMIPLVDLFFYDSKINEQKKFSTFTLGLNSKSNNYSAKASVNH